MCGIAGILDIKAMRPIERDRLMAMSDALAHRGPDGADHYMDVGIGIAQRRLAIIDVAGGRQPLFNETGRIVLVCNGEIYNYRDLVEILQAKGHRFATRSDNEVVLHAWEEWGAACVERFRGMFAFALWDGDRGELFCARDRFGEKPLYYGLTGDGFLLFGSELAGVLAGLHDPGPLDPLAIADYFTLGYVPDPRSIYQSIQKLPPAHTLLVRRDGSQRLAPYWDLQFAPGASDGVDSKPQEEQLIERLSEAVTSQLVSDVPLGAFLSGGVDSSAVVALMAGASSQPVKTCSIAFSDPSLDESSYARMVAERYGTDHWSERFDLDMTGLIDRVMAAYGEPFADSSALPSFLVSRVARQRVTVALSGDGGDEIFAGYRRHAFHLREEQVKALMPAAIRGPLFGLAARLYPKADWAPRGLRAKATFEALAGDMIAGYLRAVTLLPPDIHAGLFTPEFRRRLQGYDTGELLRDHAARAGTDDALARAQYLDIKTWLPGGMLTKVDRASMANALEVRAPFLDHHLAEWAARLPTSLKIAGMEGKVILKRALRPYLPDAVLDRPKQGFSLPLAGWLRQQLQAAVARLGDNAGLAATGWFDMTVVRRLIAEHQSGRADHARPLWALLVFSLFLERDRLHRQRRPRWQAGEAA
jgi:asparagine synthase (glutamine-hydrolysing)